MKKNDFLNGVFTDVEGKVNLCTNELSFDKQNKYNIIDVLTSVFIEAQKLDDNIKKYNSDNFAYGLKFFGGVEIDFTKNKGKTWNTVYIELEKVKKGLWLIKIDNKETDLNKAVKKITEILFYQFEITGYVDLLDRNQVYSIEDIADTTFRQKILNGYIESRALSKSNCNKEGMEVNK